MANAKKTVLVDYVKHLQELLDSIITDTFVVSSVRNLDTNKDKINVVVTPLAGSVFKNSATIPYVCEVVSNKPNEIINIFTALAKERNNKSFIEISGENEYTVFEFYSTPSVAEKDQNYETNHICRLVMYVTLNVLFEVGNVSKIEIDGEELEFSTGTLAYGTENFSLRESGEPLNKALKKAATTSLQITMVNKTSVFTTKLFQIMFGLLDGKTIFECKITLTNGFVGRLSMSLDNNAFNFAQNTPNLPSLNITLVKTKGKPALFHPITPDPLLEWVKSRRFVIGNLGSYESGDGSILAPLYKEFHVVKVRRSDFKVLEDLGTFSTIGVVENTDEPYIYVGQNLAPHSLEIPFTEYDNSNYYLEFWSDADVITAWATQVIPPRIIGYVTY